MPAKKPLKRDSAQVKPFNSNDYIGVSHGGTGRTILAVDSTIIGNGGNAVRVIKNNLNATSDPSSSNDSSHGYSVMSVWINTNNDTSYICVNSTVDNAIWKTNAGSAGEKGDQGDQGATGATGTQGDQGDTGPQGTNGIPTGGTIGQELKKVSSTDYDTQWIDDKSVISNPTGITGAMTIVNAVAITQADYDNLGSYDPAILYVVI